MKIFFAGAEHDEHRKILLDIGVKNILVSYFYLQKKPEQKIEQMLKEMKENNVNIFLDSGAFTFMYAGEKPSFEELKAYTEKYSDFITKYKDYFEIYVELDVDKVVGFDKFLELRKIMEDKGLKPSPVHHYETRTNEYWETQCKEFEYLAMGSIAQGDQLNLSKIAELINIADKYNRKVHGFGFTRIDILPKLNFYSVDSTSWLSGNRFGLTYLFTGNTLRQYNKDEKNIRAKFKDICTELNINYENFVNDTDQNAVAKFNAYNWKLFSDYLETLKTTQIAQTTQENDIQESVSNQDIKSNGYLHSRFNAVKHGFYATNPMAFNYVRCKHNCQEWQERRTCIHVLPFKDLEVRNLDEVKTMLLKLINLTGQRLIMGMNAEKNNPGLLDKAVDRVANNLVRYADVYNKIENPLPQLAIQQNNLSVTQINNSAIIEKINQRLDAINDEDAKRKLEQQKLRIFGNRQKQD